MQHPAVCFENVLPQSIPISRRARRVILSTVAFDTQHKTTRLLGIRHRQVNEESSGADLRLHVVALGSQAGGNLFLENRIGAASGFFRNAELPGLSER